MFDKYIQENSKTQKMTKIIVVHYCWLQMLRTVTWFAIRKHITKTTKKPNKYIERTFILYGRGYYSSESKCEISILDR